MEKKDNNKKGLSTGSIVAIIVIVYGILFILTAVFFYFADGRSGHDAIMTSLKFWGIMSVLTMVGLFIQSQFEKRPTRCIVICVISIIAIYAIYYELGSDYRKEAQFQEAINTIEADIDEYIDRDVLMEYAGEHLDDIVDWYGLYTEDDINSLYYDAQEAKEEAYIDGWQECCVYYGIEDEVYYTDEELESMYVENQASRSENHYAEAEAYLTPTGVRYHMSEFCAGENAIPITIEEAEDQGYTPCQKCAV